ncbi:MAG: patatin-like phospholipase family protein [Clostridia bacterium]|jgi:NTE family protein|nr:patatin-like phospholipase family protein [Clostridia bacterium]MDD4276236.1 patatin-like phospholipase family protein [Clostridia bacterium]
MKDKLKIALVLGGGAALGYAHLGVIEVLEKHDIKPDIVVGTSMGAMIGGAYAAGINVSEMLEYARQFKISQFLDFNIIKFKKCGLSSGKNITDMLEKAFGDKKIEDQSIQFIAVATDIISKEEVHIKRGSFVKAIRASISIPVVFEPVKIGKKMLVDGGILNQVPADIAKKLGADLIIAVNVTSNYKTVNQVENMIDVIENVAVVQQQVLFDLKGKNYNFLIEPELTEMRLMDFKKIDYAINSGKQATEKIINEIVAFKKTKQEKLDKKIQKTLEMQKSKI